MNQINRIIKVLSSLDRDMFPEASRYLESVVEGDDEHTLYQIASNLVECDKPKVFPFYLVQLIIDLYEEEIKEGNHYAMNDLGARYYCGDRGFQQSFEKAVYYYNMAAQHGNRQAQENLGYCYYYGRDMPVDYEKAFQYFALGAFDGHLISLYKIGDMYRNGYYVKKNEKEAHGRNVGLSAYYKYYISITKRIIRCGRRIKHRGDRCDEGKFQQYKRSKAAIAGEA